MKSSIILGGIFLISGAMVLTGVAVQSSSNTGADAVATAPGIRPSEATLTLNVPGMHCEFACAPKVRETLAAVPGVSDVETNVDDKTATIIVEEGFELEVAVAKLEEAGYPATVK